MRFRFFLLPALAFAANQIPFNANEKNTSGLVKSIIIDTDMMTDVDDVGALAIANVFHNCGLCDLRAVMINTHSEYGALTASVGLVQTIRYRTDCGETVEQVINTYFGNGHVPIASIRPITNETFFDRQTFLLSDYASKVAHNFPRDLNDTAQTPSPVDLYHDVLSSAEDHSITLISIGFLTNIAALLDSNDGLELITSKVRELVIMGGEYPFGWEWNFGGVDPGSTAKVINNWPGSVPITYSGLELGKDIFSGQSLRQHAPPDSPILAAYEWYSGRCSTTRESWDPITILYAVLGLDGFETLGVEAPFAYANTHGYNCINSEDASNVWINDTAVANQHWLKLANGVTNISVASLLTQLYAHDPDSRSCF